MWGVAPGPTTPAAVADVARSCHKGAVYVDRLDLLPRGARVLVGLSGGVDSSVAAARLLARGFDVVGVTFHLWEPDDPRAAPSRCCAPEDIEDARRTASALGIPFFTFDRQRDFSAHVVDPFVEAYLGGRTPSPCVSCNREVKIGGFVALAARLGAVAFATGHYARSGAIDGRPALLRGVDRDKDQSYFLHGIGPAALAMLVCPLGDATKPAVRAEAAAGGLPNASKPDSEDLCFTHGDHAGFVADRARDRVRPGPIVDATGRVVGRHDGVHRYTVGQRRGLGVALGRPAFVTAIDPATATVHVGEGHLVDAGGARLTGVSWLEPPPPPDRPVLARIRYRHDGASARVSIDDGVCVHFATPARAVTPGQVCVLYDGERVLGGGTIVGALP